MRTKFLLSTLAILMLSACGDMNEINQEYYNRGESIYIGKVIDVKTSTGYGSVHFDITLNNDPRISKLTIFWNDRAESTEMDIVRPGSGSFTVEQDLTLPEGSYVFEMITSDKAGNTSVVTEVPVDILGDNYCKKLRNRAVLTTEWQEDECLHLSWESIASKDIVYCNVVYMGPDGEKSLRVEPDDATTVIDDILSDSYQVITMFQPEGNLDVFPAVAKTYSVPQFLLLLKKSRFAECFVAGDNTSVLSNGRRLSLIWDNKTSNPNILHADDVAPFKYPHKFTIDLGQSARIYKFRLWPRTDNAAYGGHSPKTFEVWAAANLAKDPKDAEYWDTDAWKSDWTKIVDADILKPASSADQKSTWSEGWEFSIDESLGKFHYIRIVVTSNWGNTNYINIGEISLWGDPR